MIVVLFYFPTPIDCCVVCSKVMFLGVVAKPIESRNFDGKIFIERVAKYEAYKKSVTSEQFSDDGAVNACLRGGEWKDVLVDADDMTLGELRLTLAQNYHLDDDIAPRLVLRCYHPTGKDGKRVPCYYNEEDNVIPATDRLKSGQYTLMVQYLSKTKTREGDKRYNDVSCDSEYMEGVMARVGVAIRDKYGWVDNDVPIFLYLDNAGGHGTQEIVDKYVRALKDKHNIICVHQRPRSPATNMLDLGAWMALQNVIERLSFRKRKEKDCLARTVGEAWGKFESVKLTNIWHRWRLVLDLIIDDEDGDRLVESRRGKLFRAPLDEVEDMETEMAEAAEEGESEADAIAAADAEC